MNITTQNLIIAVLMTIVTTVLLGVVYPLVVTGLAQVLFPDKANGQLIERDGKIVGSRIIGQAFSSPGYFRVAAVGGRHRLRCGELGRHQPGADEQEADRRGQGGRRGRAEGESRVAGADRSRDLVGVRPRPAHLAGGGGVPGAARRARARRRRGRDPTPGRRAHRRASARLPRRAGRQRARAEPRARRAASR